MSISNSFKGIGRLVADPQLKRIPSGNFVLEGAIAINESYKDSSLGVKKEKICYINFKVWNKLGEVLANYLVKGKKVAFEGRLMQDTWIDERTNLKHQKYWVNIDEMQCLDSKPQENSYENSYNGYNGNQYKTSNQGYQERKQYAAAQNTQQSQQSTQAQTQSSSLPTQAEYDKMLKPEMTETEALNNIFPDSKAVPF